MFKIEGNREEDSASTEGEIDDVESIDSLSEEEDSDRVKEETLRSLGN